MAVCAKCNTKVEDGLTRCPSSNCRASLVKSGAFTEVLGWVVTIVSAIPLIVGEKTVEQAYYLPIISGAAVLFLGIVLIVVGRSQSRADEERVREEDPSARFAGK